MNCLLIQIKMFTKLTLICLLMFMEAPWKVMPKPLQDGVSTKAESVLFNARFLLTVTHSTVSHSVNIMTLYCFSKSDPSKNLLIS